MRGCGLTGLLALPSALRITGTRLTCCASLSFLHGVVHSVHPARQPITPCTPLKWLGESEWF